MKLRASNDFAVSARFYSDDSIADVAAHYADDFAAKGWATDIRDMQGGTLIIADKLDRKAAATISKNAEGRTQVDLLVTDIPK